MAYVYKLTRSDGLEYIGITMSLKRRLGEHKRSARFSVGIKNYDILFEGDYQECEKREEYYIQFYNTHKNGLNVTKSGKGKNDIDNFNTFGYKFSEKSKEKMRKAKIGIVPWNKGISLSEDIRKQMSEKRKGKIHSSKLKEDQVKEIKLLYNNKAKVNDEYKIGSIGKNGIEITYELLFCKHFSQVYNVVPACIKKIILNKSWTNVQI